MSPDRFPADRLPADLVAALDHAAMVPVLLVASDFDGCLAPIVSRPEDARPLPESRAALLDAAALERTPVAVISGRALTDLARLSGLGDSAITLIGSHGSEFDTGFPQEITAGHRDLLARIVGEFRSIAADHPGVTVETKPVSTALHVRNATAGDAESALTRARRGPASWDGVEATEGKAVIELAVIETSKGIALDVLRERSGADVVIYLGDDVTDEKAFAHLRTGTDLSIKVGTGNTLAQYRIDDPYAVAAVLAHVAARRAEALGTRSV
ncbi:trehalose-phosphatase [Gordonia desulfuricans]|uniref:Trehalose 6-phosphate phosphatase n=1 Tax=Gordonia desulfuricans TaxID=89051 RepID=A0A7K3LNW6_9ACTN|nr:trehalose-phosphatase [Gordonia desulfuricans]NDK89247.1 trehalose-phosphatase [Gordonia desulfuricans]